MGIPKERDFVSRDDFKLEVLSCFNWRAGKAPSMGDWIKPFYFAYDT